MLSDPSKSYLRTKRLMPSKEAIACWWAINTHERIRATTSHCWCCGYPQLRLERAHITPRCMGGSDEPSNLHLLCSRCHVETEGLNEKSYWRFLDATPFDPWIHEDSFARRFDYAVGDQIVPSLLQWQRENAIRYTRVTLAARKAAGVTLGRPRLLAPELAADIRAQRAAGSTLQAIADRLNTAGTLTPTGRLWTPTLVRNVTLQVNDEETT